MLDFSKNYNEFNNTLNLFNKIYGIVVSNINMLLYYKSTNTTCMLSWEKINYKSVNI